MVPLPDSPPQLYRVDEDQADDPEASWHSLLTAEEIGARYPDFAPLFTGEGTETLTYVNELFRVRIEPVYES
jgi:hypothetical protein